MLRIEIGSAKVSTEKLLLIAAGFFLCSFLCVCCIFINVKNLLHFILGGRIAFDCAIAASHTGLPLVLVPRGWRGNGEAVKYIFQFISQLLTIPYFFRSVSQK
jgi:hypothetical protein